MTPGTTPGTGVETSDQIVSAYQGYYFEHEPPAVAKTEVHYKDTVFTAWETKDNKIYGAVIIEGKPATYNDTKDTYFQIAPSGTTPAAASVAVNESTWGLIVAYVQPTTSGSTEGYGTLYVEPVILNVDTKNYTVSAKLGTPIKIADSAACPWIVPAGNDKEDNHKYYLVYESWDKDKGVCSIVMTELDVTANLSSTPPSINITVANTTPVTIVPSQTGADVYIQQYASDNNYLSYSNGDLTLNFSSLSTPPTSVNIALFTPWNSQILSLTDQNNQSTTTVQVSLSNGQGSISVNASLTNGEYEYDITVGTTKYTVTTDGLVQLGLDVVDVAYSSGQLQPPSSPNIVGNALGVTVTNNNGTVTVEAPSKTAYLYVVIPTSNDTVVAKGVGSITFTVSGDQVTVGSKTYTATGDVVVYLACADVVPVAGPGKYVSSSMGKTVNAYLHPRPVATLFTFESNGQALNALLVAYTDYSEAFPSTMWGDWYGDFMNARAKVAVFDLSTGNLLYTYELPGDKMSLYDYPVTCCAYPFVSGNLVAWMYGSLWGSMTGNIPDIYVAALNAEYDTSKSTWSFNIVGAQPAPSELYTQTNPYVAMIGEDNGTYYYMVEYSDNIGGFGYVNISCATVAVTLDSSTGAVKDVKVMYTGPVTTCKQNNYQYCPAFALFPDHGTVYSVYYVGDTGPHAKGDVYTCVNKLTTSLGVVAQEPAIEVAERLSAVENQLTSQVSQIGEEINTLENDVNNLKQTVSTLEKDVNELKTNVSNLQEKVNKLENKGAPVTPIAIVLGLAALAPVLRRR